MHLLNPLLDDKILDQTKLKAFADDKLNVTKMIISIFDQVENFVGKGEIACRSNFSFSQKVFKRLRSQTRQKVSLCGNGLSTFFFKSMADIEYTRYQGTKFLFCRSRLWTISHCSKL